MRLFRLFLMMVLSAGISAANAQDNVKKAGSDTAMQEVIDSRAEHLSKDKVEYVQQVTRYGFKNLFKNYTYNPLIPYSQQINPYAESYMQDYLNGHKTYLLKLQKNATPYFNLIDRILSQYGLPHELKYLAVIESDLKSNALSVAGALGPWQFMPGTAKLYGLRVNQNVDDRMDYTKSTYAAARYLLDLYRNLKDWLLVIAAYNGGSGRVYSAIQKSGSRNFWKLQYYLPEESRNHVKKFIATHFIMENGNQGNGSMYAQDAAKPVIPDSLKASITSATISGRYKASVIAETVGMEWKVFNMINPNLDNVLSTGENYDLKLPREKMDVFEDRKYDILNKSVEELLNNVRIDSKTVYGNSGNKKSGR